MQTTLKKAVSFEGIGVHSGKDVRVTIYPASLNSGIVFRRSDIPNTRTHHIHASWENVSDTSFCTTLQNIHSVSVGTVEHVMAALAFLGIDNAVIDVTGPEMPIMDGSAGPFVNGMRAVGVRSLQAPRKVLRVLKSVDVRGTHGQLVKLSPGEGFTLNVTVDLSSRASSVGMQSLRVNLRDNLDEILAEARTFGFYEDAEKLWSLGLAKGASLENTIVLKDNALMNEEGLRFNDEFVRHKILDAVGDLALSGYLVEGTYEGFNPGHGLNYQLLCALFADPSQYEIVEEQPSFVPLATPRFYDRACALPSRI